MYAITSLLPLHDFPFSFVPSSSSFQSSQRDMPLLPPSITRNSLFPSPFCSLVLLHPPDHLPFPSSQGDGAGRIRCRCGAVQGRLSTPVSACHQGHSRIGTPVGELWSKVVSLLPFSLILLSYPLLFSPARRHVPGILHWLGLRVVFLLFC
ncbi:hypothetical protein E2C01_097764 [Portunus trituberculatus]|uniref:Uncharacterized protein n=1 Tax=Portunus trituberculatus TaxID=210409 RepID=A0A5B7KAW6_PORTR|nr:hypothetical protein [Portunus trituberculatus]